MERELDQFTIELPVFSGPLDLLLHLVQKEQVSIWDISLSRVTEEYLSYLDTMQELNLEITCEFLVVAATLLQIKARSLLPKPSTVIQGEEYETEESLIQRLLEYRKFKMAVDNFSVMAGQESEVFTKIYVDTALGAESEPAPVLETGVTIWDLLDTVQDLLTSHNVEVAAKESPQVPRKIVSLTETILNLRKRFQGSYRSSLRELLLQCESRSELIATFLASLELIRLGVITLTKRGLTEIQLVSGGYESEHC